MRNYFCSVNYCKTPDVVGADSISARCKTNILRKISVWDGHTSHGSRCYNINEQTCFHGESRSVRLLSKFYYYNNKKVYLFEIIDKSRHKW